MMHYNSNNTNQITDINALQFIHKLRNFMHIISMQSNAADITLSGTGRITSRYTVMSGSGCISKI